MKFTKYKNQVWSLETENQTIHGTSKKDCLRQLEEHTRQKSAHESNLKKLPLKESFMLFLADFKAKQ